MVLLYCFHSIHFVQSQRRRNQSNNRYHLILTTVHRQQKQIHHPLPRSQTSNPQINSISGTLSIRFGLDGLEALSLDDFGSLQSLKVAGFWVELVVWRYVVTMWWHFIFVRKWTVESEVRLKFPDYSMVHQVSTSVTMSVPAAFGYIIDIATVWWFTRFTYTLPLYIYTTLCIT